MNVAESSDEQSPLIDVSAADRMTKCRRAAYGVGHVLNDICAALWFSYTLLFMQVVLGMQPILAGALLMIGQVADALATPIVGLLTDRFGSRKMWHLGGTALVVLSFPLIFETCFNCNTIPVVVVTNITAIIGPASDPAAEWMLIFYYVSLIIVFQIGWAVVQISHLSLIPDLSSTQTGRAELTAIRYTASVCSSVTVYIITWSVLHSTKKGDMDKLGPGDGYKFREIVLIGLIIGIACSAWFHLGLRRAGRHTVHAASNRRLRNQSSIASYFQSPLLFQVASLYVASRLFLTISLVYVPLYLDEGLHENTEILASVPLVSYVTSLLASLGIKYFNNYFGSKVSYLLGGITSIAGCIWIAYGMGQDYINNEIYGVAVLLGAGSSITTVTSLCITADLIGTETESGAFVYSIVTFADKLITGLAVVIIEYLKCPRPEECPHYYRDILAYVCGSSALLGLIVLATLAPIPLGNKTTTTSSTKLNGYQSEKNNTLTDHNIFLSSH